MFYNGNDVTETAFRNCYRNAEAINAYKAFDSQIVQPELNSAPITRSTQRSIDDFNDDSKKEESKEVPSNQQKFVGKFLQFWDEYLIYSDADLEEYFNDFPKSLKTRD